MRALTLLLSFLLLCGVFADRCEDEVPLPNQLYLDRHGGEYHLHGHFRVHLNESRFISFRVERESYFRSYVGEHELIDIDLYLLNGTGSYVAYSIEFNEEEMIAQVLKPGQYQLEVVPFTVDTEGDEVKYICQFVQLEIAIAPVALIKQRETTFTFAQSQLPGPFNLGGLTQGRPYNYESSGYVGGREPTLNVKVAYNFSKNAPAYTILAKYPIDLISKPGTNPLFKFTTSIGYNFLTAGSLRLLLEPTNGSYTGKIPQCFTADEPEQCFQGTNEGQNLNVISTVLGSGKYLLWLYDKTEDRLPRTEVVPDGFSFSLHVAQLHSDETFVSCDALPLPKNWNIPGLIDDTGYMSYREPVLLDIEAKEETATFKVPYPFLFRAWSEAHRVDVDFQVSEGSKVLARTYKGAREEESLVLKLEPNKQYTFSIKYYSSLAEIFCEKIWMEIMIQPLTDYYKIDYCSGRHTYVPAFPNLNQISQAVTLPAQNYVHVWGRNHTEVVSKVRITPLVDMRLTAQLESHFLDGLRVQLKAVNITRTFTTASARGLQTISAILTARRTYELVIQGGPHQYMPQMNDFPPCASFRFSFGVERFSPGSGLGVISRCPWIPTLPTDFTSPRFFGTSTRVHLQDYFLIPTANGFETSKEINIRVVQKSLFRAYTEPRKRNDVDIDFAMTQDGVDLNHTVKEYGEEKITQVLLPGKTYVFKIIFYADFSTVPSCSTFNLELEIAPIHQIPATPCVSIVPQASAINIRYIVREYLDDRIFQFEQTKQSYLTRIPLRVSTRSAVFARLLVSYDFVWNDLSIRVINDQDGRLVALGDNDYNKNQIIGLRLATGNYTIEIFEPAPLEDEELHHCSSFQFSIGVAPSHDDLYPDTSVVTDDEDEPDCKKLFLPATYDDIAFLSYLNEYTFHTAGLVRIHSDKPAEVVSFTIQNESILRVYVPAYDVFDVDIYVYSMITGGTQRNKTIAKSTSYQGEEQVFVTLQPGRYQLEFKSFFRPSGVQCLAFPAEIGIISKTVLTKYQQQNAICSSPTTSLEAQLKSPGPYHKDGSRITSKKDYKLTSSFSITTPSLFVAQIHYPFFTGHLELNLKGTNIQTPFLSAPASKTLGGFLGQDTAFLDHVLYPGNYVLEIEDEENYGNYSFCSEWTLDYQLFPGLVPDGYCDDADKLPTDLFSYRGRSRFYGGPQKLDGNVHISGKHFILPDSKSHNYIEFNVKSPSFVRVWAKFEDETKNDIDFLLWKNASKKTLISASAGLESTESHSIFLLGQPEPYVLDVFVYARSIEECNFLHFEFVVEPNATVIEDMLCPVPLPSPLLPPSEIHVNSPSFSYFGDEFVFTRDFIQTHKVSRYFYDEVTYVMKIHVDDNYKYAIQASLGYNFLWSDYEIQLYQGLQRKAVSQGDLALSQDSWDDFRSVLEGSLENGHYELRIVEKIYSKELKAKLVGTCEKFTFNLNIERVGDTGNENFRIVSVNPPQARDLNVDNYLKIEILFSQPLGAINAHTDDVVGWLSRTEAVYLAQPFRKLKPVFASWNKQTTLLTVNFIGLKTGQTWNLNITSSFFLSASRVFCSPYNRIHAYSTLSCDCHGRGTCADRNQTRAGCICNAPFAGFDCTKCMDGYHLSGTTCQRNTKCNANSCNRHGDCTDSDGYPVCLCQKGYESTGAADGACGKCHTGYSGYPNCKPNSDSRALHCEAPLLPVTLDSVAYLGVDGQLHLQGDYYMDINHFGHDMKFTLTTESFFRVYTEPHDVDIDLWLFREKKENEEEIVAYGIAFNEEETLFLRLGPGKYRLALQYLIFREYTTCPTFNFELAIEPVQDFKNLVDKYRSVCGVEDVLPQIPMPGSTIPLSNTWVYSPSTVFTVRSKDIDIENRTFFSFDFKVPAVPHKNVLFQVDIGYRFMTGDIAARLEEKQESTNSWQVVGYGYNGYNQHFLKHNLDEGTYSLILYLPAPVNRSDSPCSPFTLKIDTRWVTQDEDVFNCDFSELPDNLDSITLRGEKDHITINDQFLIQEWDDNTVFTVSVQSILRVYASAPVVFHYQLEKKNGNNWIRVASDVDDELYQDNLQPGNTYRLRFLFTYFSNSQHFCPTLRLALSIVPRVDALEPFTNLVCLGRQQNSLPQLPTGHITLPFEFSGKKDGFTELTFYAFKEFGTTVGSWNFHVNDNIYLHARIGSDFLMGNLRIQIVNSRRNIIKSFNNLHEAFLETELAPGNYTLQILQAPRNLMSPACVPFSFSLKMLRLTQWKADPCNGKGIDLPTSFSSLRYSGGRHEIKIVSDQWKIPSELTNQTLLHTKKIYFNVTEQSLMRLYIGVHVVDIDVGLFSTTNEQTSLGRGSDLNGEESFVAQIFPGSYFIRLLFWNVDGEIPICPTFNMEVVIESVSDLPKRKALCANGGSAPEAWPSIPRTISEADLPFQHSYTGFYQQVEHNVFNHSLKSYAIQFDTAVDFHVEVGYNFLLGDLVITLTNPEGTVTHGINKATKNILNAKGLSSGVYILKIHEATQNHKDFIACSDFTMFFLINKASSTDARDEVVGVPFPKSFDSIEYLMFSDEVHVQEPRYVLDLGGLPFLRRAPVLSLNLKVPSLLRVATSQVDPITISMGRLGEQKVKDLIIRLPEGRHNVTFHLQEFRLSRYLPVNLQIALEPINGAKTWMDLMCARDIPIWQAPQIVVRPTDGLYQYSSVAARISTQMLESQTLFVLPFEVAKESIVSVQVLFQFITGNMNLMLNDRFTTHHGTADWNMNDLNALVLPGKFNLTLSRGQLFPKTIFPLTCGEFSIRISISPKGSGQDRVDCSEAALFPWDFNSPIGGSSAYGGPMVAGSLNVWGDKFLLNGGSGNLQAKFSIGVPSLVSIFLHQHTWARIGLRLIDGKTLQPVSASSSQMNYFQSATTYKVIPNGTQDYVSRLYYQPNQWQACSTFTFGIAVQPLTEAVSYLTGQCSRSQKIEIPHKITSSPVQISSHFTNADLTAHTIDGRQFQYEVEFSITQDSALDVTIQFNPLVSSFLLRLLRRTNATSPYTAVLRGEWEPVDGTASGLTQIIDSDLLVSVAKDYKLLITQPVSLQRQFDPQASLCFPFTFTLQLENLKGTNNAFVRYVEPGGGDHFDPRRTIWIELRFSSALFDISNVALTRSYASAQYITGSIKLQQLGASAAVFPVRAIVPEDNPTPDDLTRWLLEFPQGFNYGASYQLALVPGRIFAADKSEMRIPTNHTYSMSPLNEACSRFGRWNGQKCVCDEGAHRTGATCSDCEPGFRLENDVCVRPGACEATTCGCAAQSTPTHCVAIGTCSVDPQNPSKVFCLCPIAYSGPNCERCAVGFVNKSGTCSKDCNPPCHSGTCDVEAGVCRCKGNFMGPACDTCKPGFMGSNCESESGSILAKLVGIILGALIVVILIALIAWYWRMRSGSQYEHLDDGDENDFMQGMDAGNKGNIQRPELGSESDSVSADPNEIEFSSSGEDK